MNQSLEMDYCDLKNFYLFPETDLRSDFEYFMPLCMNLCKHLILFITLGSKQKMLFIYTEIFEILVMHNVITKSFPLFNSIWPYIPELTQWGQNNLMTMLLFFFLYALYRVIFYTRDLLTALITSIFTFYNYNDMDLESYPIDDSESNNSIDGEDDQSVDEEEEEYEGDDEDNDIDVEDNDTDYEDNDTDDEDNDTDDEDNDTGDEDNDTDDEDNAINAENNVENGELGRRDHFQNLVYPTIMNPNFIHSCPIHNFYPVFNYIPPYPFYIPDIRSYSSDEFYSANEVNEASDDSEDSDVESDSDSDTSDYSLDGANRYYQYEDDRHVDVFGYHNGNI